MHETLVNRLGGLSLPRKSVVRLTDRPDITLDVYRGRKTTMQQQQQPISDKEKYLHLRKSSNATQFKQCLQKFWCICLAKWAYTVIHVV